MGSLSCSSVNLVILLTLSAFIAGISACWAREPSVPIFPLHPHTCDSVHQWQGWANIRSNEDIDTVHKEPKSRAYARSKYQLVPGLTSTPYLRIAINYGDRCCEVAQKRNCRSALKRGADFCIAYRPDVLDPEWRQTHDSIMSQTRGAGLWLWKPYIIALTLCNVHWTSSILYMDSASDVTMDLLPVFALPTIFNQAVVPFSAPSRRHERQYTRGDVFTVAVTQGALSPDELLSIADSPQLLAGFSVWNQTETMPSTHQLIAKSASGWALLWLRWCQIPNLLDDTDRNSFVGSNMPGYLEHTHDQSVFSVLAKMTRLSADLDPTGQYRVLNATDATPVWIHLHRDRS